MTKILHRSFIILMLISLFLIGESQYKENNLSTHQSPYQLGPHVDCTIEYDARLMNKTSTTLLEKYSDCYDRDIEYLARHDLLRAKALWLKRTKGIEAVEDFLLDGINRLEGSQLLHIMLGQLYTSQKRWHEALQHLDIAEVKVNDRTRLIVEAHIGKFSEGSDMSLVPYDLTDQIINQATVSDQHQQSFTLQRISDGNSTHINGEPAMATSVDGQNIWVTWTDSGVSTVINGEDFYWWKIKSVQSTDGGKTWQFVDMNPLSAVTERFHFDPMAVYDNDNGVFYAGLALKGFNGVGNSSEDDDGFYMYRWHPDNGTQAGPFYTEVPGLTDKGWLSIKDGDIYRTHHDGLDRSVDMAESFTNLPEFGTYLNPYHRINEHDNDCLFITDVNRVVTCDDNDQPISIARNFSSITGPFNLYFADDNDVPGTFRVAVSIHNIIHPNGEIYVVYSSYDQLNPNDISLYMAKSSDNGMNWSSPWVIASHQGSDKIIPWVEVDDQGRLHVIYFDTRHGSEDDTSDQATLDLYYQYSHDLGLTWQETRVTSTSLTVPELIWGDYFFSDYLSMNIENNTVNIAFPWSDTAGQMQMYFAQGTIGDNDVIFLNGFE